MPLVEVDVEPYSGKLPEEVRRFLREAQERIEQFQQSSRVPAFVPSDYVGGYRVLAALSDSLVIRGQQFCEWGSGLGVVTCLAAMLGFEACGIEISPELVSEAQALADDADLSAEFVCGSFVPPGAEKQIYQAGDYAWFTTESDHAYEELGLDLADMDLVFGYPWPDEEGIFQELFAKYAGNGAILATYQGTGEFKLRRKVRR
jgi:hypothetical protein